MRFIYTYTVFAVLFSLHNANCPLEAAEPGPPIKLTLHPAAPPTPALKYKLLPGYMHRIPNNAAVEYGKVTAEEILFFSNRKIKEDYHRWLETPLDDLRRNRAHLPSQGGIENSLRRAARCKYCDWQLPIGEEPYYPMTLPEVQQAREFGRILAARARLEMVDGQFDKAILTFQAGYALGRNVSTSETLVSGLVGIAVCSVMNRQVIDFIQQPDSPNLYWALSTLPKPLIDMRTAVEVEALGVDLSFPEIRDLETAERTPEEWRELFHRFSRQMLKWTAVDKDKEMKPAEEIDKACEQVFPAAKASLIDRGMPKEKVDQMSVHQVAMLYTMQLYRELVDDAVKFYPLTYPQAIEGIKAAIGQAKTAGQDGRAIVPIAVRTLLVFQSVRTATVRIDRDIAFLQVLEALRAHAAAHDGQLPDKLTDITEVPVPDDPVTGKPFSYRLENDTATIHSPDIQNALPFHYTVIMAQPDLGD